MDDITGLFSGANLITSVEVPEDSIASFRRLIDIRDDLLSIEEEIKKAALRADPWPTVVSEAFEGDPNKKLIRVGHDFYVLDVTQIPV